MASIYDWSTTPASNSSSDSGINWAEGQAPSSVNNSARQLMARVAELIIDLGGATAVAGTNTLTFTAASAFTAYANGRMLVFRAVNDNTGAVTLNVNSIGAKAIVKMDSTGDVALVGGEIQSTGIYTVHYQTALNGGAGAWLLKNPTVNSVATGCVSDFAGATAPVGWLLCFGQAVSRTTYAVLFGVVGTTYGVGDGVSTFNLPDLRGRVIAGKDDMGGTSANRLTVAGSGLDGDVLGAAGGLETHALSTAELASHTHTQQGSFASGLVSADHSHTQQGSFASGTESATHFHTLGYNVPVNTVTSHRGGSPSLYALDQQIPPSTGTESATHTHTTTISGATSGISANHTHTTTISGATVAAGSGTAHNNTQPTLILNKIIKT